MDTTEYLRATAIALFPEEITDDDARAVMDHMAMVKDLEGFKIIFREATIADGSKRSYFKFSKVVSRNDLGTGWIVNITGKLFEAGYEDVAWRLTRIAQDDAAEESTTESFPEELFRDTLEDDGEETAKY